MPVYSYPGIQVNISSPFGVDTFLLLPVRRISLYINTVNDYVDTIKLLHNLFDFVFKADVIKQCLKKRIAPLQSVKVTRSTY